MIMWFLSFPWKGNPLQYSCLENPMDGGAWCPWGHKESDTTERLYFTNYFVIMMYHIDWFANIEPPLGPLNKSHLIMVYDPFYILLNLAC